MRENDLCPELRKQSSQKSRLLIFPQSRLSYFSLIVRFYVRDPNSGLIAQRLRTSTLSCTRKVMCVCVCIYTCGTLDFPFFAFSAGRKQPFGGGWERMDSLSLFQSFSSVLAGSALSQLAQENWVWCWLGLAERIFLFTCYEARRTRWELGSSSPEHWTKSKNAAVNNAD